MSASSPKRALTFLVYGALFVALVVALLWFQGIIGRPEHDLHDVPESGVPLGQLSADARQVAVALEEAPLLEEHPARVEAMDPARVAARVMAVVDEVTVREGDAVEAGQVLVRLDAEDAEARRSQAAAALEAAEARVVAAEAAYARSEKLSAAGNLSAQALEGARAERDAARAFRRAAADTLSEADTALAWHSIEAPFAGRVLTRGVEAGDLTQPGRILVSVYRPNALRIVADVPEAHASALAGEDAKLYLEFDGLGTDALPITRVLPETDARTGTVTVHVDLPGGAIAPGGVVRPGTLGRVGVRTGSRERLTLPAAAIEHIGQVERAWVVREGHARPVNVRTVPIGTKGGVEPRVEVLHGLEEGDMVLVR